MKKVTEAARSLTYENGRVVVIHRTPTIGNARSIVEEGFKIGHGAMYGPGLYSTYDLESAFASKSSSDFKNMTNWYGDYAVKLTANLDRVLITDYKIAKDVYGSKYSLIDQWLEFKLADRKMYIPPLIVAASDYLEKSFNDATMSAHVAYQMLVKGFMDPDERKGDATSWRDSILRIHKIKGMIYSGNKDGNVFVAYHPDTLHPVGYYEGQVIEDAEFHPLGEKIKTRREIVADVSEHLLANTRNGITKLQFDQSLPTDMLEKAAKLFTERFSLCTYNVDKVNILEYKGEVAFQFFDGAWKKGAVPDDLPVLLDGIVIQGGNHKSSRLHLDSCRLEFGNFDPGFMTNCIMKGGTWFGGNNGVFDLSNTWVNGRYNDPRRGKIESTLNPEEFYAKKQESVEPTFYVDEDLWALQQTDESFSYNSLDPASQDRLYDSFYNSYMQAVGSAFDRSDFEWRARSWEFYGEVEGGIAVRRQRSGMLKLNASWGGLKSIVRAYNELTTENPITPIWGLVTPEIAKMLTKLSRNEFKQPPGLFVKTALPHFKHIFGAEVKKVDANGDVHVEFMGKVIIKRFVANKTYYNDLMNNLKANPDKLPFPPAVANVLFGILKMFI